MIETEQEIKKPNAFRFMDFQIEQQGSTQFVYVLPFSARKALVEVTRFGAETINHTQAENLLADYIQRNFGAYTVADVETGCIPMSNTVIESNAVSGIVLLGARNYHIKQNTC
jgi:lycopene beta-cyclase